MIFQGVDREEDEVTETGSGEAAGPSKSNAYWRGYWLNEWTSDIPLYDLTLASVGLRVSVSHDLGEIACNLMMLFADMRYALGDAGDEAISKSHKCMHLTPVDGSSVIFFCSEP